jgi:hyperosmotically inducible periplasmic protein
VARSLHDGTRMTFSRTIAIAVFALAAAGGCKKDSARTEADNTAKNTRDKDVTPTADNAVDSRSDLDLTKRIRQAVMDDKSLSTNAHNSKIVVESGKVTLVGPVASADEVTRVGELAASVVGEKNVVNQLEIAK